MVFSPDVVIYNVKNATIKKNKLVIKGLQYFDLNDCPIEFRPLERFCSVNVNYYEFYNMTRSKEPIPENRYILGEKYRSIGQFMITK